MKYKILVAPFPFGELHTKKIRPVLCLSEPIGKYEELILAYITTKVPSQILSSDLVLEEKTDEFKKTKLLRTSIIRLHKLLTLPKDMIIGELGELSPHVKKEVDAKLKKLFV